MNVKTKQKFKANGIDVYESVDRLMGMENLYDSLLLDFLADENFDIMKKSLAAGDTSTAFNAAHALKGVAGNLGMEKFYRRLHPTVEKLRRGESDVALEEIEILENEYKKIKKLIEENIKKEV